MKAHRVDTKVAGDGSVTIRGLPFRAGEDVEVIILPRHGSGQSDSDRRPLQGSVRRYERPFDSAVDADEWEAA